MKHIIGWHGWNSVHHFSTIAAYRWLELKNQGTHVFCQSKSILWLLVTWWCKEPGHQQASYWPTVYPKKYAHGFVVLCFVVVMQSFIMNSHEVFIHIHQGCFAGTGAIVRLPQCQWSKPDGYGKISQCITTTKHSKAKTVCIFLGINCNLHANLPALEQTTPRHGGNWVLQGKN